MRRLLLFCLAAFLTTTGRAQLFINEISQGTANKEYVEFVVTGPRTCTDSTRDLRGIIFDDNPGWYHNSGTSSGCYRFAPIAAWSAVPLGSIILIYNAGDKNTSITAADDPTDANNDGVYIIPSSNTTLLQVGNLPTTGSTTFDYNTVTTWAAPTTASWGTALIMGNGGDVFHIVNPTVSTSTATHSVGFGALSGGTQTPTIYFAPAGGGTAHYNEAGQPAQQSSWTSGAVPTTETPGAGNTTANAAWISGMKASLNGAIRLYVDSNAAASGSGLSWSSAKKTVAEALTIANSGVCVSDVWVKKGTYFPAKRNGDTTASRDSSLRILRNGIKLYGGFAGGELTLSARNVAANPTILSGDIGGLNDSADNAYHVVTVVATPTTIIDSTTVVDGFTITRGVAKGTASFTVNGQTFNQQDGGGIFMHANAAGIYCGPRLENLTFLRNTANYGGGLYGWAFGNGGGTLSPIIRRSTFTRNDAIYFGGGMCVFGAAKLGSVRVDSCVFTANSLTATATETVGGGGAMHISASRLTLSASTIDSNTAHCAAGLKTNTSRSTITGTRFRGNTVYGTNTSLWLSGTDVSSPGGGAAYHCFADTFAYADCRFENNSGLANGGVFTTGWSSDTTHGTVERCLFAGNVSTGFSGGGLKAEVERVHFVVRNCVFTGNISNGGGGGGASLINSRLVAEQNVFVNNSAPNGTAGAIRMVTGARTYLAGNTFLNNTALNAPRTFIQPGLDTARLANNIIWGDSTQQIDGPIAYTNSLIRGIAPNATSFSATPHFSNAADPDGPDNIWATADDGLHLNFFSPARNTGANASISAGITTDIAGAARTQQSVVDMGAYEGPETVCPGGTRVYVDSSVAASGNGTSWTQAFKTAWEGLEVANGCANINEVWVAKGTYFPMIHGGAVATSRDSSLRILRNGVKVYGGFAGGETLLSQQNAAANLTILSGDIGTANDSTDNSHHVVTISASTAAPSIDTTTVLNGFIVTRGNANGVGNISINGAFASRDDGGGVFTAASAPGRSCAPLIEGCTITRNFGDVGGGIYTSSYNGGANSTLLRRCTISANTAADAGGVNARADGSGGTNNTVVDRCLITGNRATDDGGGLAVNNTGASATLTIRKSVVRGNTSASEGGGVAVFGGAALAAENSVFEANSTVQTGGGIFVTGSTSVATNCVFTGNTTTGPAFNGGGGLYVGSGSAVVNNSTFSNNGTASTGQASSSGVRNFGTCTLNNTIVWGDSTAQTQGTIAYNSSNVKGINPPAGSMSVPPQFINAADPDGPDNIWATSDDGLRLAFLSPSINAGNNALIPAGVTVDIIGSPRTQGSAVDMGAYESVVTCNPGIVYVDSSKTVSGDGSSWAQAFKTVSEGLATANRCPSATEVWVARGTYFPMETPTTVATSRDETFRILRNGVKLYGGFAGGETALSQRSIVGNPTILSAELGSPTDSADNAHHVMVIFARAAAPIDTNTVVSGFTITRGTATLSTTPSYNGVPVGRGNGGGIYNAGTGTGNSCSPLIDSCTFLRNYAFFGGGLYNAGFNNGLSSPIVRNCSFIENRASTSGGGMINNLNSSPRITGCTFTGNYANNLGAGAWCPAAGTNAAYFQNCTFTNNTGSATTSSGGGIYFSGATSSPLVTNCAFTGNKAFEGGGITTFADSLSLTGCTFSANQAFDDGGAIQATGTAITMAVCTATANTANYAAVLRLWPGAQLNATGCMFSGNSAGVASVIRNGSALPSIVRNSRFLSNTSTNGSVIQNFGGGRGTFINCVFSSNSVTGSGGVLSNDSGNSVFTQCVFADNAANGASGQGGGALWIEDDSVTVTNCTFSNNTTTSTIRPNSNTISARTTATVIVNNSIIWGAAPQHVTALGTVLYNRSDVKGITPPPNNFSIDPKFMNAADPDGADNVWATVDDGLRLSPCSSLLDSGNNALISSLGVTADITGAQRIQNFAVDLGAYEHPYTSAGLPDVTIAATPQPACQGQLVTLTATGVNGGAASYQFYRNSTLVQTGPSTTYASSTFANNDTVWVRLTNTDCGYSDTSARVVLTIIPAQLHVDSTVAVSGTGLSWASPLKTLDEALDLANASTSCPATILVKKGTYFPMLNPTTKATSRDSSLRILRNGIKVYGGFGGNDTTFATRNPTLYPTFMSGEIGLANDTTDNAYHVLTIVGSASSNIDTNTIVDGFTITRGRGVGGAFFAVNGTQLGATDGAGILNAGNGTGNNSSPIIQNCIFTRNSGSFGVAMYNASYSGGKSSPIIRNCVFTVNNGSNGACMSNYGTNSSPTVSNCTFSYNTSNRAAAIDNNGGAGIASGTFTNCSFLYNRSVATTNGYGAIALTGSTSRPKFSRCFFMGNSAVGNGGAIYATNTTDTVSDCVFTQNTAANGGAFAGTTSASSVLLRCVFSQDSAIQKGGAISISGTSTTTLFNCLLTGNYGGSGLDTGGGALFVLGSAVNLNNCTFNGNVTTSTAYPAGNSVVALSGATVAVNNTIIWGSAAAQMAGTGITYNSSDVRGIAATLNTDPLFINPTDPDGADNTWATTDDGLRLGPCSPALNAGSNSLVPASITTDVTGVTARILNTTVDMGTYEHPYSFPGLPDVTITATPQPSCAGVNITFSATPVNPGTASYQWFRNSTSVQTGASATFASSTLANNDTVWVVLTNTDCNLRDTSNRIVVTVTGTPAVPGAITGNQTPCINSTQTYNIAAVAGATSYTWTVPGGAGGGWTGNGTVTTTPSFTTTVGGTSGNVQVTAATSCGTSNPSSLPVTVQQTPANPGAIAGSATPCVGSTQTYSVTPVAGVTYTWTLPGAGWSGTSTTATLNATVGTASGPIKVKAMNLCGSDSSSLVVNPVGAPAQPGTITGSASPCAGTSQTYTITAVTGAAGYAWTVPAGWTVTAGNGTVSITATAGATAGNITVKSGNICDTSALRTLPVTPTGTPATPGTITGNTSICAGSSQTYSIAPVSGATSYNWTLPAGWNGGTTSVTTTSASLTINAGNTGGNVSVTATSGCGTSTASTLPVTVSTPPPAPGTITGPAAPCVGTSQTYTIAAVTGATQYNWTVPGTGWVINSATNTLNATVGATAGNITVTAQNGCGNSAASSFAVTPNSAPVQPLLITGSTQPCVGTATTYSIAAVPNTTNYTWTVPTGWAGGAGGTTTSISTTPTTAAGSVTVTANNVCGSSNPATLSVTPITTPAQPGTITAPTLICQSAPGTYSVPAVPTASSYAWTLPNGWTGSSTSNTIVATPGTASGTISVTATNTCGTSPARTLAVTVTPLPGTPSPISGPSPVCAGSTNVYTTAGSAAATSYVWTLPSGWSGSVAGASVTATASGPAGSTGTITVKGQNACGQSLTASLSVTANPLTPTTASIAATGPTTVCPGVPVTFTATVTGGGTAPAFVWTRNGNVQTGVTGTTFTVSNPVTGDVIGFQMTSNAVCPSPAVVSAAPITITVLPPVMPGININTQFSTAPVVCAATQLNFVANITGGGTTPTYQWRRNGNIVGTNAPTYSAAAWTNGETVYCTLTSNAQCATPASMNSNVVTVTVTANVTPSISISASPGTTFIAGQPVTFTATTTGAGPSPQVQWLRNGQTIQGGFTNPYTTTLLTGGDTITARLTSSDPCASPLTAMSNALIMVRSTGVGTVAGGANVGLYPNPNDGCFTVAVEGARIGLRTQLQVFNALGQVVWTREVISEKTSWSVPVEIADVAAGIYLLRMTGEDGSRYTQRFEVHAK